MGALARGSRGGAAGTEQHAGADRRHDGCSGAKHLFLDAANAQAVPAELTGAGAPHPPRRVVGRAAPERLAGAARHRPLPVAIDPAWAFNIIYSSGTTRHAQGHRAVARDALGPGAGAAAAGYDSDCVTLIATPLSRTPTLVVGDPTLARGGALVLCPKFDCAQYLALAAQHPRHAHDAGAVQYQRLMTWPDFDRHDLSSLSLQGLHQRAVLAPR